MEEEVKVNEERNVELEEYKKKEKKKKLVSRIINIIIWIILIIWAAIVVSDYIQVHNQKEPRFCWFNEKTTEYSDGSVTECMGLGYKVIDYNRTSFDAIEFGPFWLKPHDNANE